MIKRYKGNEARAVFLFLVFHGWNSLNICIYRHEKDDKVKRGGRTEEPKWTIMIRGKNLIPLAGHFCKLYLNTKQSIYLKKKKLLLCNTIKSEIYIPKRQYSIFAGKVCFTNMFIVQIHLCYNSYSFVTVLRTSNILQID